MADMSVCVGVHLFAFGRPERSERKQTVSSPTRQPPTSNLPFSVERSTPLLELLPQSDLFSCLMVTRRLLRACIAVQCTRPPARSTTSLQNLPRTVCSGRFNEGYVAHSPCRLGPADTHAHLDVRVRRSAHTGPEKCAGFWIV
jgi:hypothetical protein